MYCVDTSSLIAYLEGAAGQDVEIIDAAFADRAAVISPVVLTEILSDPGLNRTLRATLMEIPRLTITDGYWERAGALRSKLLAAGRKARLADTLIAQSCLDHRAILVTRDRDFRSFQQSAGLQIA